MKVCPMFDMTCPYCLDSGECTLETAKEDCDAWYGIEEEDDE